MVLTGCEVVFPLVPPSIDAPPVRVDEPLAYWRFDEGAGITAADASGHDNTGTLLNGPTWTSGGIHFDGVDDSVDIGDPADLRLTGSMTLSAHVTFDRIVEADMPIVTKRGGSPNRGWELYSDSGQFVVDVAIDGSTYVARYGVPAIQIDTSYHVVGVYDAAVGTLHIYIDGTLADDPTLHGNTSPVPAVPFSQFNSALHVVIGRSASSSTGQQFPGIIDEVRIYDRALSTAEVAALP